MPSLFTFTERFAVHLPQHLLTGLTSFSETRTLLKENKGDLICKSWQASDPSLVSYLPPASFQGSLCCMYTHARSTGETLASNSGMLAEEFQGPWAQDSLHCELCDLVLDF